MAKILLCDDSATMLQLFEKRLRDAGHDVVAKAHDGEEGLKAFAQSDPEVTLLDVTMPNKDGRECLRGILKMKPDAKVIMISALNDQNVIQECLNTGAKSFVLKNQLLKESDFKNEVLTVIEKVLKAA